MASRVTNLAAFNRDLERFARKLSGDDLLKVQKKLTLDVLSGVVLKTPVKSGRAKGSWQVSQGAPPTGDVDTLDKNGGSTIVRGVGNLAGLRPFSVTFVASNLVYILPLEEGSSTQAPNGMVGVTLEEIRSIFG